MGLSERRMQRLMHPSMPTLLRLFLSHHEGLGKYPWPQYKVFIMRQQARTYKRRSHMTTFTNSLGWSTALRGELQGIRLRQRAYTRGDIQKEETHNAAVAWPHTDNCLNSFEGLHPPACPVLSHCIRVILPRQWHICPRLILRALSGRRCQPEC